MNSRAVLALLLTILIWGLVPVFTRSLSLALGPADHLVIRYSLASLGFIALAIATKAWRIAGGDWPRLIAASLIGLVGYNLGWAYGFAHVSAGIGSLIFATQPLLIAIVAAVVNREGLSASTLIGIVVAFAGTFLLVWNDIGAISGSADFLLGCTLVFLCGLAWTIYMLASKPLVQRYGSFTITSLSMVIASIAMIAMLAQPTTLATVRAMSLPQWLAMAYMVVPCTFLSVITWNYGVARMPAAVSGAFLYLMPPISVAAGALLLGEPVTADMLAGGGLILTGVAIAQFGPLSGGLGIRRSQS